MNDLNALATAAQLARDAAKEHDSRMFAEVARRLTKMWERMKEEEARDENR